MEGYYETDPPSAVGLDQMRYGAEQRLSTASQLRKVSLREQLTSQKTFNEREVKRLTSLLELLDKNPAIEQFMDLSQSR